MKSNPPDGGRPDGLRYDERVAEARARLGPLASTFVHSERLGSTNDVALQWTAKASAEGRDAEGFVVVADEQTAGRGRRGHAWFSPPRAGLYASVVLAPSRSIDPARAMQLLTLAAGVAIAEGVAAATGLHVDLKWPNDLHVDGRKLAGILAEGVAERRVVLGYGINVAPAAFPPELGERATSLERELGREVDRAQVLVETLAALARRYADLLAGRFDAILDAWRARAPRANGARVAWTVNEDTRSGVTAGIDDDGALVVRCGDGVERVVAGEVTWL